MSVAARRWPGRSLPGLPAGWGTFSAAAVLLAGVLAACGGGEDDALPGGPIEADGCAHVVEVEVQPEPDATYRFDVAVRSADTGWEKYADAWEIRSPDGTVLGTRALTHPHVDEQPFTRRLRGVVIPAGVSEVEVAARDLVEGFCGTTMRVGIPSHP